MTQSADEDQRDVARVLAGETDAFAALVERHQGRIRNHLARCVGPDDADDLAQDTFVRAFQALDRFDQTYPFRGWLLVIASRLAANHGARRRERPSGGSMPEPAPRRDDDPAAAFADRDARDELVRRLDAALATLPPDARALYELRFRQECPVNELAHHFQISEGALKVRVHRLRQALAEHLGIDSPQEA
ncbi:MAG: sigma-70 family RNA polymerase sigma factor [Planctomycetes bacterium]|nr:sigma-70 family RNA polymerase sigma factor [Planctomycetota bacterium]